jgi:hypothetical protein
MFVVILSAALWFGVPGSPSIASEVAIKNFIFFNRDRHRINEASFLESDNVVGAQLKYTWKELEPGKDRYDFSGIRDDLEFLSRHGKSLFIQVQDISFTKKWVSVPRYIVDDSEYNGGVALQYDTDDDDNIRSEDGRIARRWDKNVATRFHKLLAALGKEFDGKIEGINLSETAVGFGETGKLYPKGFTPEIYRQAILNQMGALSAAFPNSTAIQYANFMPGEWLPWEDKGYLESLYEYAKAHDVGMGGPDIKIYKKAQMNHSYKFLKAFTDDIDVGMAVQYGNYEEINPKASKQVRVEEIYAFGQDEIGADYIFWSTQEPYYSRSVLPFIASLSLD